MPEINLGNVNNQQEEIELNNLRVTNEVSTLDGVRIIEEKTEECVERLEDILDEVDGELAKKADISTIKDMSQATADYHMGFYIDADGDLCQI